MNVCSEANDSDVFIHTVGVYVYIYLYISDDINYLRVERVLHMDKFIMIHVDV